MSWNLISSVLFDGVFAAIAAIGFAVISNPPRKAILISALLAAVGHALRFYLLNHTAFGLIPSTLCASFTIGLFSIYFARLIHCPAEVFSFPSLLPMIPGMYAYKTILALIRFMRTEDEEILPNLIVEIFRNGLTTFFVLAVFGYRGTIAVVYFPQTSNFNDSFFEEKESKYE